MDTQLAITVRNLIKGLPKSIRDSVQTASREYFSKLDFNQVMFDKIDDIMRLKALRYGFHSISKTSPDDTKFLYFSILTLINGIIAQIHSRQDQPLKPQALSLKVQPTSDSSTTVTRKEPNDTNKRKAQAASTSSSTDSRPPKTPKLKAQQSAKSEGVVQQSDACQKAASPMEVETIGIKPMNSTTTIQDDTRSLAKTKASEEEAARSSTEQQDSGTRRDKRSKSLTDFIPPKFSKRDLITQALLASKFCEKQWDRMPTPPVKCSKSLKDCLACNLILLSSRVTPCSTPDCLCRNVGHVIAPSNFKKIQLAHDQRKLLKIVELTAPKPRDFDCHMPPMLADTYLQAISMEFDSESRRQQYVAARTVSIFKEIIQRNANAAETESERSTSTTG